jgi:hypothetical protein
MPDMVKKVQKHCEVYLAGESVEGAVYAQPAGSFGRTVAFGVAGVAGAAVSGKLAKKREGGLEGAHEGGMAAGFPQGKNVVMAVTPTRVLVFKHGAMGGNPKELIAEYRFDQVHELSLEKRRMHQSMMLRFSDNSVVDFDVVKMAKPEEFVDAFRRVKGI